MTQIGSTFANVPRPAVREMLERALARPGAAGGGGADEDAIVSLVDFLHGDPLVAIAE